ncbi:MAG: glycerate kinase [Verrucomicrobia bacterium]|nr:glycerate kinase [Verrucomicrobiota bacterium]
MRILIAPDKFKGSLSADAVAAAIEEGWRRTRPLDCIERVPISDGGDGFGFLLAGLLGAEERVTKVIDAAGRPIQASWWFHEQSRTAVIEAAQANGLAQLPSGVFHPFVLDTFGVGMLLEECAKARPLRCLIGIGGSATNDGGFGMARAVGWKFLDQRNEPISSWTELVGERAGQFKGGDESAAGFERRMSRCEPPATSISLGEILVAVDVRNPLLGEEGCTRCYGPQKGLKPGDFERAEAALGTLQAGMSSREKAGIERLPGAGAAGGLGYGLAVFLGARLVPGFDLYAEKAGLPKRIQEVDLVITGEGKIDRTTLMGKGAGGIAHLCAELGKPCIALGGGTDGEPGLAARFTRVATLVPDQTTLEEALRQPARHLADLAASVAHSTGSSVSTPR